MKASAAALAGAIALGRQDYVCFPVRANKQPACPHSFLEGSTDPADLQALWSEFPGELVGVATGPASQICVLDIDAKHAEARTWYAQHRVRLLPTRAHRTRSGGLHLIYGTVERLRNSQSKVAHGVDVRGDGGYAIWWPAAGQPVLSDAPIAPWPEWLNDLLVTAAPPSPAPIYYEPATSPVHTLNRTLGVLRAVAEAHEGSRNAVLFWGTCRARDMLVAGQMGHADGLQVLAALREAAHRAGLKPHEINRTITSAMRAA
jgi:hypothetical protein